MADCAPEFRFVFSPEFRCSVSPQRPHRTADHPCFRGAQGKIARQDIAQLCAALLEAPSATDTTFEVKTTQPFPEPFVADESTPARDWQVCAARPPPPPPPPPSLPQTARAHAYRDAFCRCRALF